MSLFSGFWQTSSYLGGRIIPTEENNLNNLNKVISPVTILLLLLAVGCSVMYILYATLFAEKLRDDSNVEKVYNVSPELAALEESQLSMIRYFENYRMIAYATMITLLLIISICCMYIVLKIK